MWLAKISRTEWVIAGSFVATAGLTILLAGPITRLMLGGDVAAALPAETLQWMETFVMIVAVFFLGALAELVFTRHQLAYSAEHLAREMVSDLMLSREQFRLLYENSPVPYFLMDDSGAIRGPNRATLRFLEGTVEQCTAANFFSLVSTEEEGHAEAGLLRTKVERGFPITKHEMTITTLVGSKRWALASIYSLEKSSQIPFKHLVTLVDVTQEKESEIVKTDFLLLASHQLRTPLTTIKWYIDYLLTTKALHVPVELREYLKQIYIGNERMIELITTLLTVSRIEMGTLAPEYKRMRFGELVQDVLDELAPELLNKSVEVKKEIDEDDMLTTDRTMLRIAVHNLCTNAIKYSPAGTTFTIAGKFTPGNCTVTVQDSGYGIPPAEQDKIFTKMFRASNARQVSANGTGLGLYLTKAFIEKLGGTMSFTSELGKGTTFTILLPRVAPDA